MKARSDTGGEWDNKPAKLRQKDRDARLRRGMAGVFRIQEPRECGCQAQADPALRGDRCGGVLPLVKSSSSFWLSCTSAGTCSATAQIERDRGATARPAASRAVFIERAARNHPLSDAQVKANRNRSKIRARIEHVFGAQETSPGGRIVRTIGIVRARAKIGLQNLAYNIRRLVTLERIAAA